MPDEMTVTEFSALNAALEALIDQDAEQALIGNVLADPKAFDLVAWMKPDFFGHSVLADIWAAIKTMRQQGRDFGPQYLTQFFENDPTIKEAGGETYLRNLAADAVAPLATTKDIAARILSLHYRRLALSCGEEIAQLARQADFETPPERILDHIENCLTQARNFKAGTSFISAASAADKAVEMALNPTAGINSGISGLHRMTRGFMPSELTVIAGRPGMGKTALGLTFAINAAIAGKRSLFFSLEMSETQLMLRVLSRFTGVAVHSGINPGRDALQEARDKAAALPFHIEPTAGATALDIAAKAAQFKRAHGLDIMFVDYLGLIKSEDPRMQKVHQIEQATQTMKNLSKTLNIPVVLLCQLSRQLEGREDKRPQLSDLRDSGAIEQDADAVIFVYREEYYAKKETPDAGHISPNAEAAILADHYAEIDAVKGRAELIIAKQRQGDTGSVPCKFSGETQVFHE